MSTDGQQQPQGATVLLQPFVDMLAKQGITASLQVLIIYIAFAYGPKFAEESIAMMKTMNETQRTQTENITKLVNLHEKTTVAIEAVSTNLQRIIDPPQTPLPNRASITPLPKTGSD